MPLAVYKLISETLGRGLILELAATLLDRLSPGFNLVILSIFSGTVSSMCFIS